MKKQILAAILGLSVLYSCTAENSAQLTGLAIEGASIFAYTDEMAASEATKFMQVEDDKATIASASNSYAKRLDRLSAPFKSYDGNTFNFKVYLSPQVNAFSAPNGDIRFYQGLMDLMTDDELRFVIGHEVGHVVLGHSKKQQWVARSTLLALKGLSLYESTAALTSGVLGQFANAFVNAKFSQHDEYASDEYALKVLKRNNYSTKAAISALEKLAQGGQTTALPILATHPSPENRIVRLKEKM